MTHLSHLFEEIKGLVMLEYLPTLGDRASFGLMFLFGLLTSFHCMGMCAGIVISGSIGKRGWSSSVMYNLGRIVSYTFIGAAAGSLGYALNMSCMPGILKGIVPVLGGTFMVLLALKYFNIFKALKKINIKMPVAIAKRIFGGKYRNTFVIGLLSSLMPCAPLQMVQLYALGTKSMITGALSAFIFCLGTVPMLLALGLVNSAVNKKYARPAVRLSAAIMLVLGIAMLGRGLALAGINVNILSTESMKTTVKEAQGIQIINTELKSDEYPAIVVKKNIPVKWNIKARKETLNDCNNKIIIPKLKIEKRLSLGDNYIEFTPPETGEIVYTCWMGMIKSSIKVIK